MKIEEAKKNLISMMSYMTADEREMETIKTVLQELDNSVSKDKIKRIFETKIHNTKYLASVDYFKEQEIIDIRVSEILEIILNELLEGEK